MLSSGMLNENNFLGGAKTIYFIAFSVASEISIDPLSCLLHTSHLSPLSLKLK